MSVYGPYRAKVVSVHDGDTITLFLDQGFGTARVAQDVRLFGVDAPELRTVAGKAARDFVAELLPVGAPVTLLSHGWDKYAPRCDGDVLLSDGRSLSEVLVAAGHALPWSGRGPKP